MIRLPRGEPHGTTQFASRNSGVTMELFEFPIVQICWPFSIVNEKLCTEDLRLMRWR